MASVGTGADIGFGGKTSFVVGSVGHQPAAADQAARPGGPTARVVVDQAPTFKQKRQPQPSASAPAPAPAPAPATSLHTVEILAPASATAATAVSNSNSNDNDSMQIGSLGPGCTRPRRAGEGQGFRPASGAAAPQPRAHSTQTLQPPQTKSEFVHADTGVFVSPRLE